MSLTKKQVMEIVRFDWVRLSAARVRECIEQAQREGRDGGEG